MDNSLIPPLGGWVYGPGSVIPDYTLTMRGLDIHISPNAHITPKNGDIKLSEILKNNNGTICWNSCRSISDDIINGTVPVIPSQR